MEFYAERMQPVVGPVSMLPQAGSSSGGTKRPMNSYAVRRDGYSVLVDAGFDWTLPGWDRLAEAGMPPRALVLTHRDVIPDAPMFDRIEADWQVPVLLHPGDAGDAPEGRTESPLDHALLDEAGLEVIEMPGHSPGSIMLYLGDMGGLLAGDSAVAPGPEQPADPPRLERPKMDGAGAFCARWRDLVEARAIDAVLPLHGRTYTRHDLGDMLFDAALRNVWQGPPMDPAG